MEIDKDLSAGQEVFLQRAENGMKWLAESQKLSAAIKAKEKELEKARQELTHSDKNDKYRHWLLEQRNKLMNKTEKSKTIFEINMELKEEGIEKEIRSLEKKKDDTLDKIDTEIRNFVSMMEKKKSDISEKLDQQIDKLRDKLKGYEIKNKLKAGILAEEGSGTLDYYNSELRRLDDQESTPKIRGLEFDLNSLRQQLYKLEKDFMGGQSPSERIAKQQQTPQPVVKPQTPPSDPVPRPETPPHTDYQPPLTTVKQMPVFELPSAKEIVKDLGYSLADEEEEEEHQKARTSDGQLRFPKILQSCKLKKKVILKK